MESGSKIDGLGLNVEKEEVNDSVTETNLVDNRLKMNNHNSNQNQVVGYNSLAGPTGTWSTSSF